ncbi:uncharacterized protein BDZ83DRAFT_640365 [Colletotrichum acutatum]|uniref:Uncharacterized protein n=1 Tax=Glomerella acutata TaxID=27357 RepID=A0AAD8UC41_GLOAC|nr:uncharacterized protein BDZ83DRAFT_640365 [Colletotrichum acutatum]KAK1710572.1 hypothetical protein BDZ83DRAFT_640365 [Colletotrichum acutatum]
MSGLRELTLDFGYREESFNHAFNVVLRQCILPSVNLLQYRALTIHDFRLTVFPNARSFLFDIRSQRQLLPILQDISSHPQLETLQINKHDWSLRDVQEVVAHVHNIRFLLLRGELDGVRVSELIPAIQQLPRLQKLALTTKQKAVYPPGPLGDSQMDEIISQKENHPLNERPAANALRLFQQCRSLRRVYLPPYWYRPFEYSGKILGVVQMAPRPPDIHSEIREWPAISEVARRQAWML